MKYCEGEGEGGLISGDSFVGDVIDSVSFICDGVCVCACVLMNDMLSEKCGV